MFDIGISYSYYDWWNLVFLGFFVLDVIFLGQINFVQIKVNLMMFDVMGCYGFIDCLSVDFMVLVVYCFSMFFSGGVGGVLSMVSEVDKMFVGLGDVSVGIYYQFVKELVDWLDIVGSFWVCVLIGWLFFGIKLIQVDVNNNNFIIDQ